MLVSHLFFYSKRFFLTAFSFATICSLVAIMIIETELTKQVQESISKDQQRLIELNIQSFKDHTRALNRMASRLVNQGHDIEQWQGDARKYRKDFLTIKRIKWLSNGKVWTYPKKRPHFLQEEKETHLDTYEIGKQVDSHFHIYKSPTHGTLLSSSHPGLNSNGEQVGLLHVDYDILTVLKRFNDDDYEIRIQIDNSSFSTGEKENDKESEYTYRQKVIVNKTPIQFEIFPSRHKEESILKAKYFRYSLYTIFYLIFLSFLYIYIRQAVTKVQIMAKLTEKTKSIESYYESSLDAHITLAPPFTNFKYANPKANEIIGANSLDELKSLGPTEVSPQFQPDGSPSGQKAYDIIKETLDKGSSITQWTLKSLTGEEIPTTIVLNTFTEDDQECIHALIRDNRKEVSLETQLLESKQFLEMAISGADLGIWDWHVKEGKIYFDKRWCEIMGFKVEEVSNEIEDWKNLVHPDEIHTSTKKMEDHFNGRTFIYQDHVRVKNGQGDWEYILSRGKIIARDDQGLPSRFIGIVHSQTEEISREQEMLLILKDHKIGLWNHQPKTDQLEWNDSSYQIYQQIPGSGDKTVKRWLEALHPDDRERSQKKYSSALGKHHMKTYEDQYRILTPTGDTKYIDCKAVIERDANAHPYRVIGIIQDITEQIKTSNEIENKTKIAEHQARLASIGKLAAGVGHEVNNPLTVIKSYTQNLQKRHTQGRLEGDYLEKTLKKIEEATFRITKIVNGLRTYSRQEDNEMKTFSPTKSLQESIDLVQEIYRSEGVTLRYNDRTPQKEMTLLGHQGKFQQVILNIFSNAKDATQNIAKSPQIEVTTKASNKDFLITISDNGDGIPKEIQEHIFDPFFTTKEVNKGTGIGLSLSLNIIKDMNGDLTFETSSSGTTFFIRVPLFKS